MVHVTVSPLEDGTSPGWSHDKVLDASWPGIVQVRILSDTDGFSLAPHDRVRD